MRFRTSCRKAALSAFAASMVLAGTPTNAQQQPPNKPNIILILSDPFGYDDAGVYGGGPNRGMPPADSIPYTAWMISPVCQAMRSVESHIGVDDCYSLIS
jgi:hypothetical protein